MGQTSTIDAAQDALKAAIDARAEFDGVTVDLGAPPRAPKKTHAWIDGAVENWTLEEETTGPINELSMKESYDVFVWILVAKLGDRMKAARDRAFQLLDGVTAALRSDDRLSNTVFSAFHSGGEAGPATHDGTMFYAMRLRIRITAYLA